MIIIVVGFLDYLCTPWNAPKRKWWNYFVGMFTKLHEHVQGSTLNKLHRGMGVWCTKYTTLIKNSFELAKHQHRLPMLPCLLTLVPLEQITTTHHQIMH
jgi:hypothetical protein